ncbi:MAG: LEPR-XLL domain-containing protein [Planctomycetaceae bacterium]|nr:LEPR-XLL domain-containing protein [Planctomycetaceae bacterium]
MEFTAPSVGQLPHDFPSSTLHRDLRGTVLIQDRLAPFCRKHHFESLESRILLAADLLISHEPTLEHPGYTTFFLTIESDRPVTALRGTVESRRMRQINPRGADTIFRDHNTVLINDGHAIYSDSQFQFSLVEDELQVVSSSESSSKLQAEFSGFTPFTNRTVAHVAVASGSSTSYSFEILTENGSETLEGNLHSTQVDVIGRRGNDFYLARSNGSRFKTSRLGATDPKIEWLEPGDVNGDGIDDLVGWNPATGQWTVGMITADGFVQSTWGTWSTKVQWTDVNLADINGDGRDDLIGRVAGHGAWWSGISTGDSFINRAEGKWSPHVNWLDIRTGDLSGDGRADMVGRVESTGELWVAVSTDDGFDTRLWGRLRADVNWGFVDVGDVNGDGREDLIARNDLNGIWFVGVSNGSRFTIQAPWDKWTKGLAWVDIQLADMNGDGLIDVFGRLKNTGQLFVAESQGDQFITRSWGRWPKKAKWTDVQTGDLNGDGRDDLFGRNLKSGKWSASLSTGRSLKRMKKWGNWRTPQKWEHVFAADF